MPRSLILFLPLIAGGLSSCLYYPPQPRGPLAQNPQMPQVNPGVQPRYNQQGAPVTNRGNGTTGGPVYQQPEAPVNQPPNNVVIEGYDNPATGGGAGGSNAPQEVPLETASNPPSNTGGNVPPQPAPDVESSYPYATPVPGKTGMVYSPYAREKGWVDVSGIAPGTKVHDPHTGKIFLVP